METAREGNPYGGFFREDVPRFGHRYEVNSFTWMP